MQVLQKVKIAAIYIFILLFFTQLLHMNIIAPLYKETHTKIIEFALRAISLV